MQRITITSLSTLIIHFISFGQSSGFLEGFPHVSMFVLDFMPFSVYCSNYFLAFVISSGHFDSCFYAPFG